MRNFILTLLLLCSFCLLASTLWAADHFIGDHGTYAGYNSGGDADGSDWNNTWDDLPATLTRGDTYYIGDGTYGSYVFNDAESSTTYIYIKKATATDHGTDTGWSGGYGDGQAEFTTSSAGATWEFTTGYWDVDGQGGGGSTGNWASGHGIKVSCTNTSSDSNQLLDFGTGTPDYFVFDQIEFAHSGVQLGRGVSKDGVYAVYAGAAGAGVTYVTISNCYFHDANRTFIITRGTSNWTLEYNQFKNVCSSTSTSDVPFQSEAWSAKGDDDHVIRYNQFVDITGSGVLYIKNDNQQASDGWEIYGNVFYRNDTHEIGNLSGGIVGSDSNDGASGVTNFKIYNNTIYNYNYYTGSGASNSGIDIDDSNSSGNVAYNNIWYDTHISSTETSGFDGLDDHDYNWFYETYQYNSGTSNSSTWASAETNGQLGSSDPFANSSTFDFSLTASTDAGTDTGASVAGNDTDMDGSTRGGDGTWDRGAYEYFTEPENYSYIGSGESYATGTAMLAGITTVPASAAITQSSNVTEPGALDLSGSDGGDGSEIVWDGANYLWAGDLTFGDWWIVRQVIFGSKITPGQDDVFENVVLPDGDEIEVTATGFYIYDSTIDGTFDMNEDVYAYNCAFSGTVVPADGTTLYATNCFFAEAEATIEAKEGTSTVTDTNCTFSVSDFGYHTDNSDYRICIDSVLLHAGTSGGSIPTEDIFGNSDVGENDVGAYEYAVDVTAGSCTTGDWDITAYKDVECFLCQDDIADFIKYEYDTGTVVETISINKNNITLFGNHNDLTGSITIETGVTGVTVYGWGTVSGGTTDTDGTNDITRNGAGWLPKFTCADE